MNVVKNLYGRKTDKSVTEERPEPQLTQEQKQLLLHHKSRSDNDPLDSLVAKRQSKASTSGYNEETESHLLDDKAPRFIKLSTGAVVDNPTSNRTYASNETGGLPLMPPWNPSVHSTNTDGYSAQFPPTPSSYPQRSYAYTNSSSSGYGSPTPWGLEYGSIDGRKPVDSNMEEMSYDVILKEARMLREDLETEYNMNRGSKEEIENQITETKLKIADARTNKPSDRIYDDIIVSLSQELTDLEKKVQEIEARMQPLDNTIGDIKHVEGFIKDRELDSQQASMLFETIMKKMFDDLSLSSHVLSGEANPGIGGMPRSVLEELQGKMHKTALKRSDPGRSNLANDGSDWTVFDDGGEGITKISDAHVDEQALKKKKRLAREKFQRVSMKLDKVVDFTQKRNASNFQRSAAFRFNAVDRADAFKDVNYVPPGGFPIQEEIPENISIGRQSGVSEKTTNEALQKLEYDRWLGYDQGTGIQFPPSDVPESIKSSKSVADLQSLDQYPGITLDFSVSGDIKATGQGKGTKLPGSGSAESQGDKGKPPLAPVSSTGASTTDNANLNLSVNMDTKLAAEGTDSKAAQDTNSEKKVDKEAPKETTDTLANALGNVQLKKASDRPTGVLIEGPPLGMDELDLGALGITITADGKNAGKKTTEASLGIKVEEKKQEETPPAPAKPPPPPPKKSAPPPPPPPPKKGAPPPPPGKKKAGAKGGPPPPPGARNKANDGLMRAPEVIALFQEMRKALLGNAAKGGGGPKKIGGGGAADPGALMDELSKNSKYAAQVAADVDKYGSIIEQLMKEVATFEAKDMPEMIEFVKRVDSVLSELTDETAVLKQFDWPQRYYTMLEAKGTYEELDKMKITFKTWKRIERKAVDELKRIQKFMDKSKNRVDVILRTKDQDEKKFKDNKIPWNPKIFTELKIASLSPLIMYMDLVLEEVKKLLTDSPEEGTPARNKALEKSLEHLRGAINFAFKSHQFAGGFTEACNIKFSDISSKTREIKNELTAS